MDCRRGDRRASPRCQTAHAYPSLVSNGPGFNQLARGARLAFCYATSHGFDVRSAPAPLAGKAVIEDDPGTLLEKITAAAKSRDHALVLSGGWFSGIHGICRGNADE
jgi:hypothetical protein